MRIRSLAFAGYRSFAGRSPADPGRKLERLDLAPLTIVLGKNNSGKSTALRLLHHALLALGHDGPDPFPMAGRGRRYGSNFRNVLHNNEFFQPLDLDLELAGEGGERASLVAQLIQSGDGADDRPPLIQRLVFDGASIDVEDGAAPHGLLPDVPEAGPWRAEARALLGASAHLGPIRQPFVDSYSMARSAAVGPRLFEGADIAQMLMADVPLRVAVGDWMEEHLEGWRIDVRQTLDTFALVVRRGRRESNLASAGQGIQQVLPVVALCCARRMKRFTGPFLDIVEQPELHLHDAAHAPVGDLLLSAVEAGQGNVVVETHSESLVLRVRRRVAEGSLDPEQVALIFVEDPVQGSGSRLRPIRLDADGEVQWWPEGVFSESFVEVKAIRRAQRARGGS